WALAVSDVDLLGAFARRAGLEDESDLVLALAAQKNLHEIRALCRRKAVAADREEALIGLLSLSCPVLKAPERIGSLCVMCGVKEDIRVLKAVMDRLEAEDLSQNVQLDFSCAGDMRYYNGIIFKGYIEGVSQSVLSGGQYDSLMRRMGKKGGAAGFAVYLDRLERLEKAGGDRC
ncbi:MAG: ATP phosphoribosyltransferase regulatory subunit, partial [Clostridia bacterium]|nr:ATP phosphoribosyltransferase regulatory subunit [Clostridia bacterium]